MLYVLFRLAHRGVEVEFQLREDIKPHVLYCSAEGVMAEQINQLVW